MVMAAMRLEKLRQLDLKLLIYICRDRGGKKRYGCCIPVVT
jgi:hypothetical protein